MDEDSEEMDESLDSGEKDDVEDAGAGTTGAGTTGAGDGAEVQDAAHTVEPPTV